MSKKHDKQSDFENYVDFGNENWLDSCHPEAVKQRLELAKVSNAIEGFEETSESIAFFKSLPAGVSDDDFIKLFKDDIEGRSDS